MKKITKRVVQVITGAATAATLLAGRTLAATSTLLATTDAETTSSNPVQEGANAVRGQGMPEELKVVFSEITNTALFAIGIISVAMLIWGGLRYITSGGDSKKVTDAKNTILYAIIGLIVALLSYAIVKFVISAVGGDTSTLE